MKIVFYGDSYVYGGGLNNEYGVKMGYIDNYGDYKKLKLNEKNNSDSYEFLVKNRWTSILENELKIKTENFGFPGHGWQYIQYYFLKNEIKNNKEEILYVFCPPRVSFKRLLISNDFNKKEWNIMKGEEFSTLNITVDWIDKRLNHTLYKDITLLDNLFSNNALDQLNFQNVFGILNYLILNKKKFIFLPSWVNSTKNSFIFGNQEEADIFEKNKKNLFIFLGFNKKEKFEDKYVYDFYEKYIFNNIDDIIIDNFWNKDENNKLPSGHPNTKAQKIITDEYAKIIKNFL
jgi:hypothetical protein